MTISSHRIPASSEHAEQFWVGGDDGFSLEKGQGSLNGRVLEGGWLGKIDLAARRDKGRKRKGGRWEMGDGRWEMRDGDGKGVSKASTTVLKISSVLAGVILKTRSLVFHFLAT